MCRPLLLAFFGLWAGGSGWAAAPRLYHQEAYQSPVHGAPDDLVLLAGYGLASTDTVVYQAIDTTTAPLVRPSRVPAKSTALRGVAPIVSSAGAPYSLTVKLPTTLRDNQSYALWIHTASGEWSQGLKINDARPFWLSPAFVYESSMPGSLPREIKVVGRNLQPAPGLSTKIRLLGPQHLTLDALSDTRSSETLDAFVARVALPPQLTPGQYRVELSRDGVSWRSLPDQSLEVLAEPKPRPEFAIDAAEFGGCRPDDGSDDTACLIQAMAAAERAGGGTVVIGAGDWDLIDSEQQGLIGDEGIVVPPGVDLRGAGSSKTRLDRHEQWTRHRPAGAALTLLGHTVISGFTFRDVQVYEARDHAGPFIQLGEHFDRVAASALTELGKTEVDQVVITANTFDKTMVAIGNGGLPIQRVFITHNTFGAFHSSLELGGNGYNMSTPFRIDDSVIVDNRFEPGSKLDMIQKSGTLATELGAGHRVDFSGNTADGASTTYLYAQNDPTGWRAGFFWDMNNSIEQVLVSQNIATCTGDKIGDGEAIAFDDNANTFALRSVTAVDAASRASITVAEPLVNRQNRRDVPIARYYIGHWVQVVDGPGLAQTRKIVSYSTDPESHKTTFQISPEWDVVPMPVRSRIAIGREVWQVYALDNRIDNRQPLCKKSNRTRHNAGVITMWAQSADSVIAGNRQYDSDGIFVHQIYIQPDHPCTDCNMESLFQFFLEIRSNLVDGEYDWSNDCSTSGIAIGAAAAAVDDAKPPTVGFGVSISHNIIRHADGQYSGAIAQLSTWSAGPAPHRWPLSDGLIIQHNTISDIEGPSALPVCGKRLPRVGITFPSEPIAWRTVLYGNTCENVATPIGPGAAEPTIICQEHAANSCECP